MYFFASVSLFQEIKKIFSDHRNLQYISKLMNKLLRFTLNFTLNLQQTIMRQRVQCTCIELTMMDLHQVLSFV